MEKLVFQTHPQVDLGSNLFIDVPVILQFEDTPLIEVVRTQDAGYTTQIPIYHEDGTYLAKVVGSQIYPTADGQKAGVTLSHPDKMTVCKLGNQTLFEIRREQAAAIKTAAELYTPTGFFVKYATETPGLLNSTGDALQIRGGIFRGNTFQGCRIGVWLKADGSIGLGNG